MINTFTKQKQKISFPIVLMLAFAFAVILMWLFGLTNKPSVIAYLGAGYSVLCFGFLIFQLVAFVLAHTAYDQSVENAKFDPIITEEKEWLKP